jgi:hypothetical protein
MREPEESMGRPAAGPEAARRPRRPEDFDAIYAGTPPWETGRPQPTFGDGWRIDSIEPAMMDNAVQRDAARCWLATITRT